MDRTIPWKSEERTQEHLQAGRDLLFWSYLYGARKGDIEFQDAIIDATIQQFTQHPQLLEKDHIGRVYKHTSKGDMLRTVLVAVITFRLPLSPLRDLLASAEPEEFRDDLRMATCQLSDTERQHIVEVDAGLLEGGEFGSTSIDVIRLKRGWQKPYPWVVRPCQFHWHGKGDCPAGIPRRPRST